MIIILAGPTLGKSYSPTHPKRCRGHPTLGPNLVHTTTTTTTTTTIITTIININININITTILLLGGRRAHPAVRE